MHSASSNSAVLVLFQALASGTGGLERVYHFICNILKPGRVVVMDNLGAHRLRRVRELIEERGCELTYLPPSEAQPDFNSMEPDRGSLLRSQASVEEGCSPRQRSSRGRDGSSSRGRERPGHRRLLRSLRLPHPGAATMKGAVSVPTANVRWSRRSNRAGSPESGTSYERVRSLCAVSFTPSLRGKSFSPTYVRGQSWILRSTRFFVAQA